MTEQTVKPEKITKPIQLLGAWLTGLFSIDSCFLFAAANLPVDSWESKALIVAAIFNVPLFLAAVFLLQTKYRPELQEDSYYSTYLSHRTNEPISKTKEDAYFVQLHQKLIEIENRIVGSSKIHAINRIQIANLSIGINHHLPDYSQLGEKLSELGVVGFSSFGAAEPPPRRVVAISEYLEQEMVNEVVKVARDLGFQHYTIFDNHGEQTEEDVLFGAYGAAQYEIAKAA